MRTRRFQWHRKALVAGVVLGAACSSADLTLPGDGDPPGEDPDDTEPAIRISDHTPHPSDVGRAVRFEVELAEEPDGDEDPIEIRASTGERCNGHDQDRQCEIVFDSPGERTVTAHFPALDAVSEPVTHLVNAVENPTRTIIGVGPDPSPAGAEVTVWITVRGSGGAPAQGRVTVYGPGSEACGEGPVAGSTELGSDGQETITVRGLQPGWHYFRGCFTGSPGFSPSEDGAAVTITP